MRFPLHASFSLALAGAALSCAAGPPPVGRATHPTPAPSGKAAAAAPGTHAHCHDPAPLHVEGLPPPPLMEGIGASDIPVTTRSERARAYVRQGVALLHCFWDFEALRAFREALRADPDCAMAHWGVAKVSNRPSRERDRRAALARMKELLPKASEHEQYYLRALLEMNDKGDEKGPEAFTREMEALLDRHPGDLDARLFLALHLMSGYDEGRRPRPGQAYAQALLANALRDRPDSAAAHHYWIHAIETSDRPWAALESARKLPKLSPASGHMVHMPGHIYYRTGDYEKAREAFLASVEVDEAYMREQHISPADDWNYGHNLSYLVANLAEMGRYAEARAAARKLEALAAPRDASQNAGYALSAGATEARLHLRFGDYEGAERAKLELGTDEGRAGAPAVAYRDGLRLYARALAASRRGERERAEHAASELEALLWRTNGLAEADGAARGGSPVLKVLSVAALEARGELASAAGQHDRAIDLLERAAIAERGVGYQEPPPFARPVLESLGHALLRAGQPARARDAFARALDQRPKSGHPLYGIARAWAQQGASGRAREAYRAFLDAWPGADASLPQIVEARAFLDGGRS